MTRRPLTLLAVAATALVIPAVDMPAAHAVAATAGSYVLTATDPAASDDAPTSTGNG